MPTEIFINPSDDDKNKPHIVRPGAQAILTDYSEGKIKKIGIRCKDDDSVSEVFIADNSILPKIPRRKAKDLQNPLFYDGNRDATIYEDVPIPYELTSRSGSLVRLLIAHTVGEKPPA